MTEWMELHVKAFFPSPFVLLKPKPAGSGVLVFLSFFFLQQALGTWLVFFSLAAGLLLYSLGFLIISSTRLLHSPETNPGGLRILQNTGLQKQQI